MPAAMGGDAANVAFCSSTAVGTPAPWWDSGHGECRDVGNDSSSGGTGHKPAFELPPPLSSLLLCSWKQQ